MENETLQAMREMFAEEREHTGRMIDEKLKPINDRLDSMDSRLDKMQADIRQIKRDTSITRITVNAIGEWVDEAQSVTQIPYPAKTGTD